MKAKVFKNSEVLVLEREINRWLEENKDISVLNTAVADNQFIILYDVAAKTESKKEEITELQPLPDTFKATISADGKVLESDPPGIVAKRMGTGQYNVGFSKGKGFKAPVIEDYYELTLEEQLKPVNAYKKLEK